MTKLTNVSIFRQTKSADGSTFLSCEGMTPDGVYVSFSVNDETELYPILTMDEKDVKPNELGPRSFLFKKATGTISMDGIRYTGKSRTATLNHDTPKEEVREYHEIKFSDIVLGYAPTTERATFRKVAPRSVASQQAPQVNAIA